MGDVGVVACAHLEPAQIGTGDGARRSATFVRYDRAPARWVWGPVSLLHRRTVAYLLRRAARGAT